MIKNMIKNMIKQDIWYYFILMKKMRKRLTKLDIFLC